MASEEEREDLSDQEESVSETESSEGSDAGMADAEPVVVAAQHNYNLRSKRVVPDSVAGTAQTNRNEVAPGVGVEANKVPVGGRDHDDPAKRKDGDLRSPAPAVEKNRTKLDAVDADSRVTSDPRDRVIDRAGGVSWNIPVPRTQGRTERLGKEADQRNSAMQRRNAGATADPPARNRSRNPSPPVSDELTWEAWDQFRRARLAERPRQTPMSDASPQPNELRRPGDFPRSPDVERKVENRLEPRTSNLLERSAPVEPGRGRKFDTRHNSKFCHCHSFLTSF